MIYILMVWTTVAVTGDRYYQNKVMDWRPVGEFHTSVDSKSAKQMCEDAGRELGLKVENFRCVRAK
jgi:hypothetical protein